MCRQIIACAFTLLFILAPVAPRLVARQPATPVFRDSTALPSGPGGARIRSFIETVNSGSVDRIKRFMSDECTREFQQSVSLDDHISAILGFSRDTGGIDFYSVRTYTPERSGTTVVIVKDRLLDSWSAISFGFGEGPTSPVTSLRMSPARPPAGIRSPATEADALVEIRAVLSRLHKQNWLSGTVLVAKGPAVLLTDFAGEANKGDHVRINLDTKFNLGSMNKMFTATAVARLVEAGKLSFDDQVSKYLDESWLPTSVTNRITVRHLITHTSGLGSYFNEEYVRSSRDLFRALDDYKPLIRNDRPAFNPGERFQDSNTGMFLLGVVIEKVTGEDYFTHIRRAIYGPAGMTSSDSHEMDYPVENLAIGYSPDWKSPYQWRNNLYRHVIKGGPAGGGFSTVGDLHRFAVALVSGKLVSSAMLKAMWQDVKGENYGYGFSVAQGPGGKSVGHNGGFQGINAQLDIYPDSGYIVAVLSNRDNGASPLADKIGSTLGGVNVSR